MNNYHEPCKIINILTGAYIQNANGEDWVFDSYVAATRYIEFVMSMCPEYVQNQFEIICIAFGKNIDIMKEIIGSTAQQLAGEIDKEMIKNLYKYTDII